MQYAKPVTLNVEVMRPSSFSTVSVWQRFSVCRGGVCTRWRKNDAGISGRLLALHPAWRTGMKMPDGDRFHMVNGANWFDRTVKVPMPQASSSTSL